jgi:6-phosphogluconate dehydrogenase
MIHEISDVASMNNTGLWCAQLGLEYGVPTPTITAAVQARTTSRYAKSLETHQSQNLFLSADIALDALRFVFAMSISEGYELVSTRNIKRKKVMKAWSKATLIECPLISGDYLAVMDETIIGARTFVMHCVRSRIPCPAIQAAVSHYDFIHQRRTSMNLLMAQRNYFGQHAIENV